MTKRVALIMAGGVGARLWPASTSERPKQLIDGLPAAGQTLLSATIDRIAPVVPVTSTYVVTTRDQRDAVCRALPDLPAENVLAEPCGRNTAACVGLSIAWLRVQLGAAFDDTIVVALPADHFVAKPETFARHLDVACRHALAGDAVTLLGIEPTRPDTGFGYIGHRERIALDGDGDGDGEIAAYQVAHFKEKPDLATAQGYLCSTSINYLWNAGVFVLPARRVEREFAAHQPQMWSTVRRVAVSLAAGEEGGAADHAYAAVAEMPFDKAIVEQQRDARVVPFDGGWTDVGSWDALATVIPSDAQGNVIVATSDGSTVVCGATNTLVWNEDATVGVIGVSDIAVVVRAGKVLVCRREDAQRVREIVDRLHKHET